MYAEHIPEHDFDRSLAVRESLPPVEARHVVCGAVFLLFFLFGLAATAYVLPTRVMPVEAATYVFPVAD